MTDRWELRKLVIAALKPEATIAHARVFSPGDTPSWDGAFPVIVVRSPYERKDSIGRVAPQFITVATITVVGQVAGPTEAEVEAQLDTLGKQIEKTIINDHELVHNNIQQFLFVETKTETTSEAKGHLGQITVAFGLEFYQGTEDFAPFHAVPLEGVDIKADMASPFDAQAIYKNPAFPSSVQPPPRTSGPDGRVEAGLSVNFEPKE
jgi:hypothetical protein